ncbi:mannose-1-phosphate guanylyltransferase/mannose-6-phosphate isomerase [Aliihoeflea sp. 40Bstr573]|uniref:mannose-1-phosphate guanylyltransferase/mannose-6-phosphate isomerase n=1 Tax=Aliihoeflea sp. 40Bstr573 TaxID=2696467 RepID=UPI002094B6ED|nr:mannose-1-phosphate guanylyltransferase/mannose-6-phosphate isomerase [Aliihoeflea sp. 40Bstr573]
MVTTVPVIISGGAGARLWPASRETFPKPLLRIDEGMSLLQKAHERAAALPGVEEIVTITNREHHWKTQSEFAEAGLDLHHRFVLEPEGRDTAAAIAVAALEVARAHAGDAVLVVLPADHMISDISAFVEASGRAIELATDGRLVTFGITPRYPETAYGYIEAEGENVIRFVEKPDRETARRYVSSGRFLWNAGMFCFRADTMIALLEEHCPDILATCRDSVDAARRVAGDEGETVSLEADAFARTRKISIDYAVLEKAADIAVVPCDMGWTDVGSWNAFADLHEPDGAGNHLIGDVLVEDSSCSLIRAQGRLVAAVGLRDMIVVDTPDALLVADKNQAQSVKKIYERLKQTGRQEYSIHTTVHRPWGSYTILDEGERFKVKRIEVVPGGRLSLQSHTHRSEHWVVVAGKATVVNDDQTLVLSPNESVYIPCGAKHRLENQGTENVALIEVQTGDYLGEDDIVRYEDIYGRA